MADPAEAASGTMYGSPRRYLRAGLCAEGRRMRRTRTASPVTRWVVSAAGLLMIDYLAVVALKPSTVDALPTGLGWFGRPGSMPNPPAEAHAPDGGD